tara:strand:- start:1245 stop:1844 length:600 start_codon:yes stop_codon:yes gene_type:complete
MKETNFNARIIDLKYHINGLVPTNVCNAFIEFFEQNKSKTGREGSYKYKENSYAEDNFSCLNLTKESLTDSSFIDPLNVAKKYITIMVQNYVLYIQNKFCPSFNNLLISNSHNIRILKYETGQCIKDHADVGLDYNRASCTLNLNENYEGGDFRFFDGQIKHSFKTGDGMIFPAEPIWIHGTEPITKGTRYSINCFLHK